MKKGLCLALAGLLIVMTCTACGDEEVKTIEREQTVETEAAQETEDTAATETADETAEEAVQEDERYMYPASENGKTIEITADMPMSDIIAQIGTGDESRYYEAASCAFEGLDKMYFYEHFEIDTYPQGDEDFVSCVYLSDDMATTKEGVYIGMSVEDMEKAYGTEYVQDGNKYSYEKGGMELEFIVEGGVIKSIGYCSTILNQQP